MVVFNPLSWTRSGCATVRVEQRPADWLEAASQARNGLLRLVDAVTGQEVQGYLRPLESGDSGEEFVAGSSGSCGATPPPGGLELSLWADDVPATGYRVYEIAGAVRAGVGADGAEPVGDAAAAVGCGSGGSGKQRSETSPGFLVMENGFYRVVIDSATGHLLELFDKESRKDFVDARSCVHLNELIRLVPHGKDYPPGFNPSQYPEFYDGTPTPWETVRSGPDGPSRSSGSRIARFDRGPLSDVVVLEPCVRLYPARRCEFRLYHRYKALEVVDYLSLRGRAPGKRCTMRSRSLLTCPDGGTRFPMPRWNPTGTSCTVLAGISRRCDTG
ncbi:MAG: hypothetical protein AB1700_13485 [Bacillota bacterium]